MIHRLIINTFNNRLKSITSLKRVHKLDLVVPIFNTSSIQLNYYLNTSLLTLILTLKIHNESIVFNYIFINRYSVYKKTPINLVIKAYRSYTHADWGIRTLDLRFTIPLLYQLS